MQRLAQAWLILRLTHNNGFALGVESGLQFLPMLLFGAWGGVIADRFDKRRILYLTQIVAGLLALGLGVIVAVGAATVFLDYLFSVLLGFVNVIDNPARQTFVMEMVGREELPNAVGLNSVVMNSSRVVGPAIGGIVIEAVGLAPCFFFNAASYLAVLVALVDDERRQLLRPVAIVPRAKGQLREGFRYVWSDRMVRTPLVMMAVIGTLAFNFQVVIPLISTQDLRARRRRLRRSDRRRWARARCSAGSAAASRRGVSYRRLLGLTYAMGISILARGGRADARDRGRRAVRDGRGVVRVHRDREHHAAADEPARDAGPGHGAVRDRVPRQHAGREPDRRLDLRGVGTARRLRGRRGRRARRRARRRGCRSRGCAPSVSTGSAPSRRARRLNARHRARATGCSPRPSSGRAAARRPGRVRTLPGCAAGGAGPRAGRG